MPLVFLLLFLITGSMENRSVKCLVLNGLIVTNLRKSCAHCGRG